MTSSRLFVRNLPTSAKLELIEDLFSSVGDIEVSEFGAPDSVTGLKTAYVKMRTEQATNDSIERYNGYKFEGRSLIVTRDEPHRPDPSFKARRKGST